jgi:NAD(P)-dependent dehydrogenase (short-subunit alcohol dehydrogenase family)
MHFRDKVVFISGSTQGIGKALARLLATQGARVVINGRDEARVQMAVAEFKSRQLNVTGMTGDVTLPADCRAMIAETLHVFKRIDILVNNAGVSAAGEATENVTPGVYEELIKANYLSAVYLTLAALPAIRGSRGSVLFVSSVAGVLGFPRNAGYCSSKMALTGFAESLKFELAGLGVHIGIAYVAYTQNEPGKMVLSPSGGLEPKKHVYSIGLVPIGKVASQLAAMLSRRKYKKVFTFSGKMLYYMNRHFPWLLQLLMNAFFAGTLRSNAKKPAE